MARGVDEVDAVDAIVLSGGAARRMGGLSKTAAEVGGRAVLARVTDALTMARRIIVVGDATGAGRVDVGTREQPAGGGPALALAAGLVHTDASTVIVVAADLPFLTVAAVEALLRSLDGHEAAVAVDDQSADQYLLAAWRTAALRGRLAGAAGRSMRSVYADVDAHRVRLAGRPPPWWDCDTPDQLTQARQWATEGNRQ